MTTKNLRRTESGKTTFAKVGIWRRGEDWMLTFPDANPVAVTQAKHPELYARLTETVEHAAAQSEG